MLDTAVKAKVIYLKFHNDGIKAENLSVKENWKREKSERKNSSETIDGNS